MRSGARSRDEQAQKSPAILRAGRDARQDLQGEDTPEVARHRGFVGTPRQASSSSQSRREDDELNAIVNGPDFAAMWEDLGTEFFDGEDVGGQASPSVSHAVNAAANLAVNEATAVLVQSQKNSAHREKGDLAREGRPVSVELFGDDDDDDEREDNDEADGSRSLSPDVSSGPGDESLSPEKKVEMEMMQLLRAATQYGQAEVDEQAKAQEERFHFEVRKAIAKSTKAAAAIRADAEAAKTGNQPTVRLRDLDAAASLASAFDEDDFESREVQSRQRRASSGVVDNIVAAIGPNSDPHRKKRKVNRKKRVQSPALAAKVAAMEKAKADKAKLAAGADGETQALDANKLTEDNKLAWNVVAAVTHHAAHMEAEKAKAKASTKDNPHNWACKVCTYRNVTTSDILTTCQMCGTKAPGLLYTPEAPEYACLSTMYLYKFFAADWKLFDAFRHEEGLATLQAEAESKWYGDLDKARFNLRLSVARSLANSLAILVQSSASLDDDECQFDPKRFLTEVYFTGKKKRAPGSPTNAATAGGDEEEAAKEGQVDVFGGPLNVANVIVASKDWGVFVPRHLCPGTVVEVYFPALAVNVTAVVEQLHCTRKFAYVMRIVKPSAYATVFEAVVDHARGIMWIKQATQHVVLCLAGASKYSVVIGASAAEAVVDSARARGVTTVSTSGGGGAKSSGASPADSPGSRQDGSVKRKHSKKKRRKQPKGGFDCILCAAANKARRLFTKTQRAADASGADAPNTTSVIHSSKPDTSAQRAAAREQQEVEAAIRAVEDAKKQDAARIAVATETAAAKAAAAVAKQHQQKQAELAAAEALMEEAVKEARAEKARKAEAARQAKLKQQQQKQERQEREKQEKECAEAKALEAQQAKAREIQEAKDREEQAARVRAERDAKARAEQELRARAEEATRAAAEQEARAAAEATALAAAAEAKAAQETAEQAAAVAAAAEAKAAAERARAEDERAEKEAEAIAKAEAEARARAAARAKAIAEAEARAKAEAEAKAAQQAEAEAKAEAEAAARREDEARRTAEAEMEAEATAAARIAEARAKLELIRTAEQRQSHAGSGVIGRLTAAKQQEETRKAVSARENAAQAKAKLAQIRTAEQRAKRTGSGTIATRAAKARQEAEQKAAQSEKALKGLYSDVSSFAVLRGMEQLQAMAASKTTQQQVEAKAQMYYDGNINRAQRAFNVGLKDMFDHLANAIRQATSKVDETFEKTVKLDAMHDKSPAARARSLQIAKRNFVQAVTQKLARKFLQVLIGNFHKNSHAGGSSDDDEEESDRSNNGRGARIRELLARRKSKKFVSSDSSYSDDEQESLPRDHSRPASWSAPPGSRENSSSPKNRRADNGKASVESQAADATDDSEESIADAPASDSLGQAASSPQTWEEPPSTDDEEVAEVDVSSPPSSANSRDPVRSAAALIKAQNADESVFIASSDSSDEGEDGDDEQPSSLQSANETVRRSPAGKGLPSSQSRKNADVEGASGDSTVTAISRSSSSSSSSSQSSIAVSPRQDGLRETNEGLPEMCQGDPATWDLATASAAFAAFAETCLMASDDEEPSLPSTDVGSPAEMSKEPKAVAGGDGQGLVHPSGAQQADNSPDPKGSGEDNDASVAKPRIRRKSARNDGHKDDKESRSKSRIARISSSGSSSADEKAKRDRHASPAQRAKAAKSALASQGDDDVIERTIAQIIKSPQAHEIIKLEANEHFDGDFDRALRMFLSSLRRESESFHEAKRKSLKNLEKRLATDEGKKILQDEAKTRFGGDLAKAKAFMVRVVSQQVRERQKNFAQRALVNFRVAAKLEKERAAEMANAGPGEGGGGGGDASRRGARKKPNMLRLRSSPSMMQRSPHAGSPSQPHPRRASTPLYTGPSSRFDGSDSPAGSTSTKRGFAKRQHSMLVGLDMLGLLDPDEAPTTSWQDIPSTVNVPRRHPRDTHKSGTSVSSMSVGSAGSAGHASDPEDSDTEQSSHTSTEAATSNAHWVCKECTYSNAGSFLRHQRCRMCGRAAADTGSVPAVDGTGAAADPSTDRKKSRKKPRSRKSSNADHASGEWSGRASNRSSHSSTEAIAVRKRVERKSSTGSRSGKRSDRTKSSSSRQSQSPQRINRVVDGRGSDSPRAASVGDAATSAGVTAPSVAEDATAVSKSGESSEEKFKRFLEENNLVVP